MASYLTDHMRVTDYTKPRKDNTSIENYKTVLFVILDSKILSEIPANGMLQCILNYIKTKFGVSLQYKDCLMREKSIKESALL